ncbi:glycosyltransferase family 4 protein [bacterium]|nr:glycosyltransferase family 4 protein [bacterium]MBU1676671.1 glycosyltransferase family 4 protein [bacterium]
MARIMVLAGYAPSLILFRRELLERLCELGHEVLACAADGDPHTSRILHEIGIQFEPVTLNRTGMNPLNDLVYLRDISRIIRSYRPHVTLAYTIKPVIYGTLVATGMGVPERFAMITGLGTSFQGTGFRALIVNRLTRWLYRASLAKCKTVFFQNPDDQALFIDANLIDQDKASMIPGSGINLDRFSFSPPPGGAPRFLMISRLIAEKGVREFARAAAIVKKIHPDARFDLVGYLEDHPSAIRPEEIEQWENENSITFHGKKTDVRPLLHESSVFVLPTAYREGIPHTILEALATGRAIITTDTPGCRETVLEGSNGHLIPVGDVESLVDVMNRFAREPRLAISMGRHSRELAEQKFDVRRVVETIVSAMGMDKAD